MGFIDSICNNLPEDGAVEAFHRGPRKSLNLYNASDSVHAVQKAIEELKANYLRSDYARSSKWYLHSCYIFRVSFLRAIGDIMAPRRSCSSYNPAWDGLENVHSQCRIMWSNFNTSRPWGYL